MGVEPNAPVLRNTAVSIACALLVNVFMANAETGGSLLTSKTDFDSRSLLAPQYRNSVSGLSFFQPGRFSMQQSYSMSFTSSSAGSMSSGLYLNTLSYRLSNPLTLSADIGFYSPFSSTLPGMRQNTLMSHGTGSSVILPRMGLEYRPSENFTMNLELLNGQDAWKAYGSSFGQPFWNRLP